MNLHFLKAKKIVCLLTCVAVILSFTACAGDSKGFAPKEKSTWAQLYQHFDKEGFKNLPQEVQDVLKADLLSDDTAKTTSPLTSDTSVAPVYPEGKEDEVKQFIENAIYSSDSGFVYLENESPDNVKDSKMMQFFIIAGPSAEENSIAYLADFVIFSDSPSANVLIALQDKQSGEYVAFHSSSEAVHTNDSNAKMTLEMTECSLEKAFPDLQKGKEYKVQAIAVACVPEGYASIDTMYALCDITL